LKRAIDDFNDFDGADDLLDDGAETPSTDWKASAEPWYPLRAISSLFRWLILLVDGAAGSRGSSTSGRRPATTSFTPTSHGFTIFAKRL
jgi:hypothetical protein